MHSCRASFRPPSQKDWSKCTFTDGGHRLGYRGHITRSVARVWYAMISSWCIRFPIAPGFVTSYTGLVIARVFLGLVEGPLAPSIVVYLSGFYTRKELSLRYVSHDYRSGVRYVNLLSRLAIIFSAASVRVKMSSERFWYWNRPQVSGAFSGLLAAAISSMDGIGGRPGWAWIFILVRSGIFYNFLLHHAIPFHIGRIIYSIRRYCWFLYCAFYTRRFAVFNRTSETVSFFSQMSPPCTYELYYL